MITKLGTDFYKGAGSPVFLVVGKAARDGEMDTTSSGRKVGRVTVKAKEREDESVMWVKISCWGDDAAVPAGVAKGQCVLAVGRIKESEYNGKTYYDLTADFIQVSGAQGSISAPAGAPPATPYDGHSDFAEVGEDDGALPFF